MDKTIIKNFAVWARGKLIADITYKAGMFGISEKGVAEELPQSTNDLKFFDIGTKDYIEVSGNQIGQRNALIKAINTKENDTGNFKEAFKFIVEEVAYTWFNRLIAIRFMEVNEYLPSEVRVLSSVNSAKSEPDLVTHPFDTDLQFTAYEKDRIYQLKDENKSDELFRMLFIKQCNKLHEILPDLFEPTEDYTELLLTLSFTDKDGVIYKLTHDIDENDFNVKETGQVEIIGWMYQYYISQKHEEVVDPIQGKIINKDDLPAATQLFTTDWVVRYMVDNSLGRYWIERNPLSQLAEELQFFVKPKNGHINYINEKINPEELTFFDPCMGSGHILVYAFDVLMEIYRECGYTDRDASESIIKNNLYGLDIDKRAYQLAYFAIMMKARSYNRRILMTNIKINVDYIEESNNINSFYCDKLTTDKKQNEIGEHLIEVYKDAKEIGTLQTIKNYDYIEFENYLQYISNNITIVNFDISKWIEVIKPIMLKLANQAKIMSKKYSVVCTNPPYMNKFDAILKNFIQENFADYKGDMFSAFMYRNFDYCIQDGYSALMTPNVWMFIKTYEKLRELIISSKSIVTLIQMAKGAFFKEATVDICTFVLSNNYRKRCGLYLRLEDFKGGMEVQKDKVLEGIFNPKCGYFYESEQSNFSKIPGFPIVYWATDNDIIAFSNKAISYYGDTSKGIITGDNNKFLRFWFEVVKDSINLNCRSYNECYESQLKWYSCNKGGEFRKWFGNNVYIINWFQNGKEIMQRGQMRLRNCQDYKNEFKFKDSITWTSISSGKPSFRYSHCAISESAGMTLFVSQNKLKYIMAYLSSNISTHYLNMLNPTLNFTAGTIATLPVIIDDLQKHKVDVIAEENIEISKQDWDSFETSWDFKKSPLI